MKTLPYDSHRCHAAQPDQNCNKCARWADLPGQTWGPRTLSTARHNSTDEHCTYIPVQEQKK